VSATVFGLEQVPFAAHEWASRQGSSCPASCGWSRRRRVDTWEFLKPEISYNKNSYNFIQIGHFLEPKYSLRLLLLLHTSL
jgi:hypothetical protein